MNYFKLKSDLYNKITILSFTVFIFFFDFLRDYVDLRFIIFIPLTFCLYQGLFQKKINIKSSLLLIFFLFLLTVQVYFKDINIDDKIYSLKSILFLGVTVTSVWYFSDYILKNINLLFNFFLVFFFLYVIFYTFYRFDIHIQYQQCYLGCFSVLNDNLRFFKENSHLGFISSTLISYMILRINKINIYFFWLIIFYFLVILNFSLTIFFTIIFILSYFLIFYFKKFNLIQKIVILFLITSSLVTVNFNSQAIDKLYNLIKINNWIVSKNENKNNIQSIDLLNNNNEFDIKNQQQKEKFFDVNNEKKTTTKDKINPQNRKNLSSEVFIVSLNITKLAIIENPFGYGFNNYHLAFKKYIEQITVTNNLTKYLNVFDASNNLAKIITEFGIFSIFIFFIFIKFLFSKKIPFEYKFIIFPSIFTQTIIRGAGYFNGGYILFVVLSCYLIYKFED